MKAVICSTFGSVSGLTFGDLATPDPGADEVLIKVHYSGVNYPDTLIVQGKYQFRPELPFVPGGEVSGEVVSFGHAVTGFEAGDLVLAAMGWGGYATHALAKASNVFKVPQGVSQKSASVLLETYATALHALKDRGALRAGERIAILGASGGTGLAATQLAKLFGATVVACVSTKEKADVCLAQGADDVLLYREGDLKNELKNLGGMDVIFDPVGGERAEEAFRALNPGGRHLVVGFASGSIPQLPWNLALLKSASVVGVFWGQFWREQPKENAHNVKMLLRWLQDGKITPVISAEFPLNEAVKALGVLQGRKALGKVVLKA